MDDMILETANRATATNAAAARVKIDAYKWRAARLKPKVYGDRIVQEHTGAGGGPIQTMDLSKLTDEQLAALEPVLSALAGGPGGVAGSGQG